MTLPPPTSSDPLPTRHSLLTRLRHWADAGGWERFFETYWSLIYRIARRAGLSEAEAEDVTQDTVVCVARGMKNGQYDASRGSFKAWLKVIVRSRVIDHQRRSVRHGTLPAGSALEAEDAVAPELDELYEREWTQHCLHAALARLKGRFAPRDFAIFDLCVLKEKPGGDVAKLLGVSRGLVYVVRHRLQRALRAELQALHREWGA